MCSSARCGNQIPYPLFINIISMHFGDVYCHNLSRTAITYFVICGICHRLSSLPPKLKPR